MAKHIANRDRLITFIGIWKCFIQLKPTTAVDRNWPRTTSNVIYQVSWGAIIQYTRVGYHTPQGCSNIGVGIQTKYRPLLRKVNTYNAWKRKVNKIIG